MISRSWFGWSALGCLAINFGQLPAVATNHVVNRDIVQARFLITINRPVLKIGSQGTDVSELQAALKLLGYFVGDVDGFYGESTASAVYRFQQASGLNADGIAGLATWNRLFPSASTATTPPRVSSRQNSTNKPASGFPVPSSLQRPNNRDTHVIVPTTVEPVNRRNTTITPATVTPTTSVSAAVNPETTVVSLPILKRGMRGPAIVQLQDRLRSLGYFSSSSDGVFGDVTQTAVKAVQQQFNIEPDGIVGAATWSILLR